MEDIEILVGTVKLSSGGTRYKVKEAIKHEEFVIPENGSPNITYDIAAIHVDGPIEFNDKVQPIEYSIEEVGAGKNLQVSGWGLNDVSSVFVKFLFDFFFFSFIFDRKHKFIN